MLAVSPLTHAACAAATGHCPRRPARARTLVCASASQAPSRRSLLGLAALGLPALVSLKAEAVDLVDQRFARGERGREGQLGQPGQRGQRGAGHPWAQRSSTLGRIQASCMKPSLLTQGGAADSRTRSRV